MFKIPIPSYYGQPQTCQIYINKKHLGSTTEFHPTDGHGNILNEVTCKAEKGTFSYTTKDHYGYQHPGEKLLVPKSLYKKGDCKSVAPGVKKQLRKDVAILEKQRKELSDAANDLYNRDKTRLGSPFVDASGLDAVLSAQKEHLDELERERLHLERMSKRIDEHVDY